MFTPEDKTVLQDTFKSLWEHFKSGAVPSDLDGTRTSFEVLDCRCKVLNALSDEIRLTRHGYAFGRNTFVTLGKLPPELVLEIITFILPNHLTNAFLYFKVLYTLGSISTSIRRIIQTTPRLWTCISSACAVPVVEEALSRSMDQPLFIRGQDGVPNGTPSPEWLLRAVGPHKRRWLSVHFAFPSFAALDATLFGPKPALRTVDISVMDGERHVGQPSFRLFEGCNALEAVSFKNIPVGWISATSQGLQALEITGASSIPPDQLLNVLDRSPAMHTLSIEFSASEQSPWPISPKPKVKLSHLEILILDTSNCRSPILEGILSNIDASSCGVVDISVHMERSDETFVEKKLLAKFPRLNQAVCTTAASELQLGAPEQSMVMWTSRGGSPEDSVELHLEFCIPGADPDYASSVKTLLPDNGRNGTCKLHVNKRFMELDSWNTGSIQEVLATCTRFNEVEIELPGESDLDLLEFLHGEMPSANEPCILFQNMSIFRIRGTAWSYHGLIGYLNRRRRQGLQPLNVILDSGVVGKRLLEVFRNHPQVAELVVKEN